MKNLKEIVREFANKEVIPNTIVAFKGIELRNLPQDLKEQFFDYMVWENDQIVVTKLFDKGFKKQVLQLTDVFTSPVFISYEALVIALPILNEFEGEAKIKVIDLSFSGYLPNNFKEEIINIEDYIESGREVPETPLYSVLTSSFEVEGQVYIRLNDNLLLEQADIETVFESNEFTYQEFGAVMENDIPAEAKSFQYETKEYIHLVYQVIQQQSTQVNIIVDQVISINTAAKEAFSRVLSLLEKLGIEVIIQRLTFDMSLSSRPELNDLLKQYWGEEAKFKTLQVYADPDVSSETLEISQATIVEAIIEEYEHGNVSSKSMQDVFFTAATGAGKSLMFQLPAFYIGDKYGALSIVVTPLKALMQDQVHNLKTRAGYKKVAYINSDISIVEREVIYESIALGMIDLLYVAPEYLLSHNITEFLGGRKLGLYVVDEAHTVTTWGRDFRADYWYLGNHINTIRKYGKDTEGNSFRFVVVAATATAPYNGIHDVVFETLMSLNMHHTRRFIGNVRRSDIQFDIRIADTEIQGNLQTYKEEQTLKRIESFEANQDKTIVYCPYSSQVRSLVHNKGSRNIHPYFGEMERADKELSVAAFKDSVSVTMAATKAFGMGVDISDITRVHHFAPTGMLTDYIQEVGRAARKPGSMGIASVDYTKRDFQYVNVLQGLNRTHDWQLVQVMKRIYKEYETTKKQNHLLNVEDFIHIFGNEKTIQNDMKNALLLIEKDLAQKAGQLPVFIARPKNLFATVYASTTKDDFAKLVQKVGKENVRIMQENKNFLDRVYIALDLDKIWEQLFRKESFSKIKFNFFQRQLFTDIDIKPVLRMDLELDNSVSETLEIFKKNFSKIHLTLLRLKGFFTEVKFVEELENQGFTKEQATAFSAVLLNVFSKQDGREIVPFKEMEDNLCFLQKRRTSDGFEYRFANTVIEKIVSKIRQSIEQAFKKNMAITRYVCINKAQHRMYTLIGQFLDIFSLGKFSTIGGENPKIFVRINDPYQFKRTFTQSYKNKLITDIRIRYDEGLKVMKYFFETKMNNEERWDYIEDYFLGKI